MATHYVRTTGNDTTGLGTIAAPYRTVGKAISLWVLDDIVDVGSGEFVETAIWDVSIARGQIRGKGFRKTIITALPVDNKLINVANALVVRLLVQELTIVQRSLGCDLLRVSLADASSRIYFMRCVMRLADAYAVNNSSTLDGIRIDLLHCVVASEDPGNKRSKCIRSVEANVVTARNTSFVNLAMVVDDAGGGSGCDLDFNYYLNNDRLVRAGSVGDKAIQGINPQFRDEVNFDFRLAATSPLRDAGVQLAAGYGTPSRMPPFELNWLHNGDYPDLSIQESVFSQGSTIVSTFNFHLVLQVFAEEFDLMLAKQDTIRRNRGLELADTRTLSEKFGILLGSFRPNDMSHDEYLTFTEDLLDMFFNAAPAVQAINRITQRLFGVLPRRIDYYNSRRFRLSPDLKMVTKLPTPSLTVTLAPGIFQIERRWYRALSTDVVLPANDTSVIYADGDVATDDIQAVIKQSTDLSLRAGFRFDSLTGTAFFQEGETRVVGSGTLFTTELEELNQIRPTGTQFLYIVEEIVSDTELILSKPYTGADITDVVQHARTIEVFGEVTTDGTTVTAIQSSGRLGQTAILNSVATHGHGYHVIVNDGTAESIFSESERTVLLRSLLARAKPTHKLGYLSFEDDLPQGVVQGSDIPPYTQSSVLYLEDWEDSTWPAK